VDVARAVLDDTHVLDVRADDFPHARDYLRAEFQRRVSERVGELADVAKRQREIGERAEELARQLYADRAFTVVEIEPPSTTALVTRQA
jgi:hypothetical protein